MSTPTAPTVADIAAMIDHTVGRVLDLFDLDVGTLKRWGEEPRRSGRSADPVPVAAAP